MAKIDRAYPGYWRDLVISVVGSKGKVNLEKDRRINENLIKNALVKRARIQYNGDKLY